VELTRSEVFKLITHGFGPFGLLALTAILVFRATPARQRG